MELLKNFHNIIVDTTIAKFHGLNFEELWHLAVFKIFEYLHGSI